MFVESGFVRKIKQNENTKYLRMKLYVYSSYIYNFEIRKYFFLILKLEKKLKNRKQQSLNFFLSSVSFR